MLYLVAILLTPFTTFPSKVCLSTLPSPVIIKSILLFKCSLNFVCSKTKSIPNLISVIISEYHLSIKGKKHC